MTIHDLRFVHDRSGLRGYVLKKILLDLPVKRLRYITAISEATRAEIVKYTGCEPSKIRVIENPVRDEFLGQQRIKEFNSSRPRILHIGITENKNIPRLIAALEGIDCTLVIVGKIDEHVRSLAQSHNIDLENRSDLSDAEIVEEYLRADLVSFCSTYEGFGMPIIEAQALGKPVVTSDITPMNSVAGDGAVLVDPFEIQSIRSGILSVMEDEGLRNKLVARGFENVRRFLPKRLASEYVELYREVLEKLEN
ncbi:MAG: glycosyltransferase family 1 protein [Pyrinomonadaceae bacterium]|nr:glycosyltransferase family 1 protein [Pyrinomonadaceae bacterium]